MAWHWDLFRLVSFHQQTLSFSPPKDNWNYLLSGSAICLRFFFSLHPSPNAITPRRFLWRLLSGNTWTSLPFYKSRLLGWSRGFRFVQTLPAGSVSVSETPCQAEIAGCEYCGEASLSIFYNLCVRPICIVSKLRADWLRRVTELRWALSERIWKCGSVVLPRTCITIK